MISSVDWGKMATCRQVTILLFAAAKEALNRSEIKLTIPNSPCSVVSNSLFRRQRDSRDKETIDPPITSREISNFNRISKVFTNCFKL
jgi:hypothetical protein